jgi:hypothetical protein
MRAGEEVGVGHPLVPNGIAQAKHHVGLPAHLREALRPVPPIERLKLFGHGDRQ